MKYKNAIITLGILIALILSPFIGISRSSKESVAILLGLLVSTLTYVGTHTKRTASTAMPPTRQETTESMVPSDDTSSNLE